MAKCAHVLCQILQGAGDTLDQTINFSDFNMSLDSVSGKFCTFSDFFIQNGLRWIITFTIIIPIKEKNQVAVNRIYDIKTLNDLEKYVQSEDPRFNVLHSLTEYNQTFDDIGNMGEGSSSWRLLISEKGIPLHYSDVLLAVKLMREVEKQKVEEGWS